MEDSKIVRPDPIKLNGLTIEVRPVDGKDAQMRELEKALKIFKKKVERDGVVFEVKERRYFTKPSAKKRAEAKKKKQRR